jgi:catechol 2,3-dioxygenase-like lactoylglutathione lyase family enzyme
MSLKWISRRDALLALGVAAMRQACADGGLLRATRVDHVALAVGDLGKALVFYRSLFGNEVLKDSRTPRRYLRLGPCYMAIAPAEAGEAKRIDHIGIGIANFNASALKTSLEGAGFKVRESDLGLFVGDPDGTSIQIWADESWKQLRNTAPDTESKQEVLFHPRGMHHIAIQTGDSARSADFYRKLFGEPIETQGNPSAPQPIFLAGETRIILYNPATGKIPKIDHFSVLVDNFDAPTAVKAVKALGANGAVLSREGTFNEFFDPEGIRLQVTFPGQTYGATPVKK